MRTASFTASRIEDDCEADPRREAPCDPDDLRTFLRERPEFLRGYL